MDNDLLVYISKLKRNYVLKDYRNKDDNILREAITADAEKNVLR